MASSTESNESRSQTDQSLQAERERSDDELLTRSTALGEDADEVIARARARAAKVLELARGLEDQQLLATGITAVQRATVQQEREVADDTLAAERAIADAERAGERERRQAAMMQLLAFERSVTDKTLAEERHEADRSVSAREDLLAVVAHDLRNMLSSVVINSSLVLMVQELELTRAPAAKIQKVGAQMAQLLEDLLDFSSFEAGKLTVALADIDLVRVVADAVSIYMEIAAETSVTLTLRAEPERVMVRGDASRLSRLLMNIIGNALKFTPPNGRVDVSVRVVGSECEIAVTDTGFGIPSDQLLSIFERFQQAHAGPRRSSGVGLGLYIARLITEAHGGRIWAECEAPGGATFRIRLPVAA